MELEMMYHLHDYFPVIFNKFDWLVGYPVLYI